MERGGKLRVDPLRGHLWHLGSLITLLAVQPLVARASGGIAELTDLAFGVVCLLIFLGFCRQPWERRTGVLLFLLIVASNLALLALLGRGHQFAAITFHGTLAVFLGFAVVVVVRLLGQATVIGRDDVLGAVGGYLLTALAWSHVYALVYLFAPQSFAVNPAIAQQFTDWRLRRTLFNHLSFTTLTSIGYSDITPVGSPLYALMWSETIFGQFYMAVVVAQLVGLKLAQAVKGDTGDPP